ncbi:hypothetical protein WSM22_42570 [Cytophagales bacterium WSM2-2]|nr:hypothetical protein WSM22_42570 [Cytophagales bacterium WSM2-2]
MKKLEDIPKKSIFEVPDGYFDQLALQIQSKTEQLSPAKPVRTWSLALRYVLPVALVAIALVFVLKPKAIEETEELLASIPSEHLVAFLHESDISEQDLLEMIQLDHKDVDSLNLQLHADFLLKNADVNELETEL